MALADIDQLMADRMLGGARFQPKIGKEHLASISSHLSEPSPNAHHAAALAWVFAVQTRVFVEDFVVTYTTDFLYFATQVERSHSGRGAPDEAVSPLTRAQAASLVFVALARLQSSAAAR